MDKGTDAVKILRNEVLPLRHGYFAVKLRGQKDINDNIPVKAARDTEE